MQEVEGQNKEEACTVPITPRGMSSSSALRSPGGGVDVVSLPLECISSPSPQDSHETVSEGAVSWSDFADFPFTPLKPSPPVTAAEGVVRGTCAEKKDGTNDPTYRTENALANPLLLHAPLSFLETTSGTDHRTCGRTTTITRRKSGSRTGTKEKEEEGGEALASPRCCPSSTEWEETPAIHDLTVEQYDVQCSDVWRRVLFALRDRLSSQNDAEPWEKAPDILPQDHPPLHRPVPIEGPVFSWTSGPSPSLPFLPTEEECLAVDHPPASPLSSRGGSSSLRRLSPASSTTTSSSRRRSGAMTLHPTVEVPLTTTTTTTATSSSVERTEEDKKEEKRKTSERKSSMRSNSVRVRRKTKKSSGSRRRTCDTDHCIHSNNSSSRRSSTTSFLHREDREEVDRALLEARKEKNTTPTDDHSSPLFRTAARDILPSTSFPSIPVAWLPMDLEALPPDQYF